MNAATCREFGYEADDRWAKCPTGWSWREATAVATDSRDRVFVFNRGDHPLMIFDRDGTFLASWGEGLFARPHGISIGPDDAVYLTDDADHTVRKFTPDGRLLLTLGTSGKPSDTGATSIDFRTIVQRRAAVPLSDQRRARAGRRNLRQRRLRQRARPQVRARRPASVLVGRAGKWAGTVPRPARHRCGPRRGRLRRRSREQPHSALHAERRVPLRVDRRRPAVSGLHRPERQVLCRRAGLSRRHVAGTSAPSPDATGGRVSIFDPKGNLLARWGGGVNPTAPGDFFAPHDICVDSRGDIYVAEVTMSAGGNRGLVSPDCHSLQKFATMGPAWATV